MFTNKFNFRRAELPSFDSIQSNCYFLKLDNALFCEISKIRYHLEPRFEQFFFLVRMSVNRRELFLVWLAEADTSKKMPAVETYIFNNLVDKTKYKGSHCIEISKRIQNFGSKF